MVDLKTFVQSQMARKESARKVDWSRRKKKWLAELDALFQFIRGALLDAGLTPDQIASSTHALREETLGPYQAPGLVVMLPAGDKVTFAPVASVIIGGYGRVDVTGPARERIKLIADDRDEDRPEGDETPSYDREWDWRVHPGVGHRGSFRLDEQGLAQLLAIVTGSL